MKKHPVVELKDVKKIYKLGEVDLPVLKGISLKVHRGDFVSIIGPSGSGKSTMLHIIGALDRPTSGDVFIDGKDVSEMNDNQLARLRGRKIGFVFQAFNLIPRLTALENVMLPMWFAEREYEDRKRRAEMLMETVGLGKRIHHTPTKLSGGERQRVAVARALANEPDMIVADEPTGNLDTKTGAEIIKLLRSINEHGTTLIIVTHDNSIARVAERIIHMMDGKIVKGGVGG
jgi:putative ABC transport system ATP-binding protein